MPTAHTPHFCRQNPPAAPTRALSPVHPATPVLAAKSAPSVDARTQHLVRTQAERRAVPERAYVQAIDAWLDGAEWAGRHWTFGSFRVHLVEEGDALTLDGVAIVSRSPIRLHDLAPGTRTGRRLEARSLAATAVRGDAGWYGGQPRRVREGVSCVWNGREYVHGPA